MTIVLGFLVFGLMLPIAGGLLASAIDRKVTARVQYRVGPPLLQPWIDLVKLLGKETLIPAGASRWVFLGAPVLGVAGVATASALLGMALWRPEGTFSGDIIVLLYLLVLPSISLMMGALASANPFASLGASREMKMVLSYELPFILAVLVPVIQTGYALRLDEIVASQAQAGIVASHPSGMLALAVALLCVVAKLGLVPFDAAEAETEIMGGLLVEYSGAPLALFRLMRSMLLFTLPLFLIVLFLGGPSAQGWGILWGALWGLGIVAVITVIRNTNPRVRVDQAVRFFWGPVTGVALAAVALAWGGY